MMGRAARYHALRGLALGILLAVATFTGLAIYNQVIEKQNATQAAGLVQGLLKADTAQTPALIAEMTNFRHWTDPLLRQENDKPTADNSSSIVVNQ